MALSATFKADFSSFFTAVDQAEVHLKDLDSTAGKVGQGLNKMAEQFSGKKVITEAALMIEAIGGIEGISKLTEKEIARLGNTTNEAVDKMKRMGTDVPKAWQDVADATKQANKQTSDWKTTLTDFASAAGLAFSVGSLITFTKGLFDAAGKIADMSDKLGVSTRAIQGWQFAAEQTGATMDDVGKAVLKMSEKISGGDKSAVAAITELGLKFSDIEDMQPEEAFDTIAAAIKNVPEPMDQARIAVELFGKSGAELLPAIRDDLIGIADAAPKMSDATVRSMDQAADHVAELWLGVKVLSAELLNLVLRGMDPAKAATDDFTDKMRGMTDHAAAGAAKLRGDLKSSLLEMTGPAHTAEDALKTFDAEQVKTKKAADDAAAGIRAHNKAISDMADTLSGKALAAKVSDLAEAVQKVGGFSKVTAFEQEKLTQQVVEMWKEGAKLPPVLEDIFAKYGAIRVILPFLSTDMGLLTAQFTNQKKPVIDLGQEYYDLDQKMQFLKDHTNDTARAMNLPGGVDWKKWQPPPTVKSEWDDFGRNVEGIARGMSSDFAASLVDMATGATSFHDGVLRIWDSIKRGVRSILSEMVSDFINQYIRGVLSGLARNAGAITVGSAGLGVGSSAGSGAGIGVGAGVSAGAVVAGAAVVPALALLGWMGYEGLTTTFDRSTGMDPDVDSGIPGLAAAQQTFDYLGPGSAYWQQFILEHPEFVGHGNGFARGTHGQYLNFGTGTPAMLHGYEKIVPRSDASASTDGGGWSPVITINAQGAFFDTPDSLRRLADRVSDALTAKYNLIGKLRPAI